MLMTVKRGNAQKAADGVARDVQGGTHHVEDAIDARDQRDAFDRHCGRSGFRHDHACHGLAVRGVAFLSDAAAAHGARSAP